VIAASPTHENAKSIGLGLTGSSGNRAMLTAMRLVFREHVRLPRLDLGLAAVQT
jgi:hypothetical protein